MKSQQILLLFILVIMISSCGFYLRGQGPNNFIGDFENEKIYLAVTSKDQVLLRQIKLDLQLARFQLVNDPEKSNNHLIVLNTTFEKRVIGTDQNGRDNEFQITQTAEYIVNHYSQELLRENEKVRYSAKPMEAEDNSKIEDQSEFENQQVRSHRSYYFDNNDPIGKKAEEISLRDSMRGELSRKMINHLLVSLSKVQQANSAD